MTDRTCLHGTPPWQRCEECEAQLVKNKIASLRKQLAASDKRVRALETALRDLVHWLEDGEENDMTAVHAARLALSHTKEGENA